MWEYWQTLQDQQDHARWLERGQLAKAIGDAYPQPEPEPVPVVGVVGEAGELW